jgi:hypothetical protein
MEASGLRGYTERLKKSRSTFSLFRYCSGIPSPEPILYQRGFLFYTAYQDSKMYST